VHTHKKISKMLWCRIGELQYSTGWCPDDD